MNRPYKELSNKYIDKIKKINSIDSTQVNTTDEFNEYVDLLLKNLHQHLNNPNSKTDDIIDHKNGVTNGWGQYITFIQNSYSVAHDKLKTLSDEERSINRIENKAHFRALIFRFLTTLFIGIGIMLVYYIAQKCGINMPLMKIPA